MPIKVGNTGIARVYLGKTEVIRKYVGSVLKYQKQSGLTIVPIGFKYSSSASDYETTNETGTLVVLLQAGRDIGTITGTYTDANRAFWKSQPLYIGNGNYVALFGKQRGYGGSGATGVYVMTMMFSSPTLGCSYTATTTALGQYDHYGVPRVRTAAAKAGFTTFDIVPMTGRTINKQVYGLAHDVVRISGNTTYRYDEQWNEVVSRNLATICTTDAASEASGTMLSASISVQRKLSILAINVAANSGASARLGDVKLTSSGNLITRHVILQEGESIRFCRINGQLVEGTALSDSRMWDYSYLRMIDLSASGTTYTFSGRNLRFFDGIASHIEVTNAEGTVITATTESTAHGTFAYYNCNSSNSTITVRIL